MYVCMLVVGVLYDPRQKCKSHGA